MTGAWGPPPGPDEEELLRGARAGERGAVERLYAAHVASARRLATILAGPAGADALVSESFSRALGQLRGGRGPASGFRSHLHATMRNVHRARSGPHPVVPDAPAVDGLDPSGSTAALASLPGGMQQALWHADVEGRRPDEVAELLGTTPARATSLVGEARERLHSAYLDRHGAARPSEEKCRWAREHLGAYVRGDLGNRASRKMGDHLAGCPACTEVYTELKRLNPQLASDKVAPIVLVGAMGAVDAAAEAPPGAAAAAVAATGPDQLLTELNARVQGKPAQEAAPAAGGVGGRLGDLPGRTAITVAAAVFAVFAIAATSWGLARHQGNETAAPNDPDVSGVTFGPNAPSTTPSPTFPTVPTDSFPTVPTFPTAPTFPSVSNPTFPAYTPPAYTPPAYTPPPYTPPATIPTTPTTTPPTTSPTNEPGGTAVTPVAPIVTKVASCGKKGRVKIVQTTGVRYDLVVGDGREGRWVIHASAREGYKIAKGATTRFSGNLGKSTRCPTELSIATVSVTATGEVADPWQVTATPAVPKNEQRALTFTFIFDTDVDVDTAGAAGWTCTGPGDDGLTVPAGSPIVCDFDSTAGQPGPVTVSVVAHDDAGDAVSPSGSATLSADDVEVDSASFAG